MKLRIKPTLPEFIPMLAEISMMVSPVALAMLPGVVIAAVPCFAGVEPKGTNNSVGK